MKRKYFSRGLGLGILVTALLFAFGLLFYKPSLSDEEIKARATLLGMTETSDRKTSSETSAATSSASSSSSSSAATSSASSSAAPSSSAEPETSAASSAEPTKSAEDPVQPKEEPSQPEPVEPTPSEPDTPVAPDTPSEPQEPDVPGGSTDTDPSELKSVTIYPSESSLKVSEDLYRAGIIDDPVSFNRYLESNGYDYNIQTGTFWISPNASYDTIAHAITNI
ncbi:MAG: hypothetical protein II745_02505 [Lachnospiraceae bacterium]|nr:hypothetical protein [Lachnospiraceae bacterium]